MAQLFWEDRTTDLEKVPSILEYVYSGLENEIKDSPSFEEYKKLKRIMKIMVRFYKKGSVAKQGQYEDAVENLKRIDDDLKMLNEQLATLNQFPEFHPKKKAYVQRLVDERTGMMRVREPYQKKADEYEALRQWSDSIVEAVQWLENEIEEYCNAELKITPPLEARNHKALSVEEVRRHAKGLDEITYNLQESQDFFDASVDGRLNQFHQIEKCMIMAQLGALKKWPEDSQRRQYIEEELQKDLEYVEANMHEDDDKKKHKQRMRSMHRDFWAVLRWQRRRLKKQLNETDIEADDGTLRPKPANAPSSGGVCPVGGDASGAGKCPVAGP